MIFYIKKYYPVMLTLIVVGLINLAFYLFLDRNEYHNYSSNRYWYFGLAIILMFLYRFFQTRFYLPFILLIVVSFLVAYPSIPKRIAKASHFEKVCKIEQGNFYLAKDLDFDGVEKQVLSELPDKFVYNACMTKGVINGNNHTIYNLDARLFVGLDYHEQESLIKNMIFEGNTSPILYAVYRSKVDTIVINSAVITDQRAVFIDQIWISRVSNVVINQPTVSGETVSLFADKFDHSTFKDVSIQEVVSTAEELSVIGNYNDSCILGIVPNGYDVFGENLTVSFHEVEGIVYLGKKLCNIEVKNISISTTSVMELEYWESVSWVRLIHARLNQQNIDIDLKEHRE